jgi:hypothetical protein
MKAGHKGYSQTGGLAAMGLTLVAILVAEVIVLEMEMIHSGFRGSMSDLPSANLHAYFYDPKGFIIMLVGMLAAYRTASGRIKR